MNIQFYAEAEGECFSPEEMNFLLLRQGKFSLYVSGTSEVQKNAGPAFFCSRENLSGSDRDQS